MASLRDTCFHMLVAFPTLFANKADCLRHLFLTSGGGYEWVDGELVSVYIDRNHPWMVPQYRDEMVELLKYEDETVRPLELHATGNDFIIGQKKLDVRRINNQIKFVIDNFDLLMEEPVQFNRLSEITRSKYEAIFHIPDDVKPDWLEAAKRTVDAVMAYCHGERLRRFNAEATRAAMVQLSEERLDNFIDKRKNIIEKMLAGLNKSN